MALNCPLRGNEMAMRIRRLVLGCRIRSEVGPDRSANSEPPLKDTERPLVTQDNIGAEPVRADIANSDVCRLPPLLRREWYRARRPRWVIVRTYGLDRWSAT